MCPCALSPPGFDVILLLLAWRLTEVEVDDMNNQVSPTECDAAPPLLMEETRRRIKGV